MNVFFWYRWQQFVKRLLKYDTFLFSFPGALLAFKSLTKMVSEHKDVLKMISMLSTIVSSSKIEAVKVLNSFKDYEELWKEVSWMKYFRTFLELARLRDITKIGLFRHYTYTVFLRNWFSYLLILYFLYLLCSSLYIRIFPL